jgi:hypothetical protein
MDQPGGRRRHLDLSVRIGEFARPLETRVEDHWPDHRRLQVRRKLLRAKLIPIADLP